MSTRLQPENLTKIVPIAKYSKVHWKSAGLQSLVGVRLDNVGECKVLVAVYMYIIVSQNIETKVLKKKLTWSNEMHVHVIAPVVVVAVNGWWLVDWHSTSSWPMFSALARCVVMLSTPVPYGDGGESGARENWTHGYGIFFWHSAHRPTCENKISTQLFFKKKVEVK